MATFTCLRIESAGRQAVWVGLALATASFVAAAAVVAVSHPVHKASATARPTAALGAQPSAALDVLREEALLGNSGASHDLVLHLLARYDERRDDGALFEASMWFDRDWTTPEYLSSSLSARLLDRECGHPILRWHWLCVQGE